MKELVDLIAQYGLGVALVVFVLIDSSRRELRLTKVIENHLHALTVAVNEIARVITEHDKRAQEIWFYDIKTAQEHQRSEHARIVESLAEIVVILKQLTTVTR